MSKRAHHTDPNARLTRELMGTTTPGVIPVPMTKKAQAAQEREEAIARLRKVLKPGSTVRTILRHRARSGMFQVISLVIIGKAHTGKPEIWCIDGDACTILDRKYHSKHEGIPMGGCGMDMGFHLVYSLSRALFPKGFKVPKGKTGRNGDTSGWDNDGGYALNHRWL